MINLQNIRVAAKNFIENKPFPHIVVDNFFNIEFATLLAAEFPDFESDTWFEYSNAIEEKKALNNWNLFPPNTYQAFTYLNSQEFVDFLGENLYEDRFLTSDPGLHGGGWHIHKAGGKLNTHLDYSIHPKLQQQRRVNIIMYMNPDWDEKWGGDLGLWDNESSKAPGKLIVSIPPLFNRAVIFDTTHNSWHGLPEAITCPQNQYRKSLAVYYLCEPKKGADVRGRALFAPTQQQENNPEVLDLIKKRSDVTNSLDVYKSGKT